MFNLLINSKGNKNIKICLVEILSTLNFIIETFNSLFFFSSSLNLLNQEKCVLKNISLTLNMTAKQF